MHKLLTSCRERRPVSKSELLELGPSQDRRSLLDSIAEEYQPIAVVKQHLKTYVCTLN